MDTTSPELELIRALAEDLALEILASYAPEDFADADFTSLGKAHLRSGIRLTCTSPGAAPSGSLVPGPKSARRI